jgi:hypothetical protein
MKKDSGRIFYLNLNDWIWWAWTLTTVLLTVGLSGYEPAFVGATVLTVLHGVVVLARDRSLTAYSVQLRAAYLLLLLICFLPFMHWLYWLITVGTFALNIFGYCFLTRVLSLFPWNSREPHTLDRWRRTFFSAPNLERAKENPKLADCAGGLCTIEAQVAPPKPSIQSDRSFVDPALEPVPIFLER